MSVGPNTFRYFHHLPLQPSVVYREWAIRTITPELIDRLLRCDDQTEYDSMLRQMVSSLRRTWLRKMGKTLDIGPAIKLPSLLLKHLCASTLVAATRLTAATRFLHTPLDSYTLAAILTVHNGSVNDKECSIPSAAGMGWVSSWRQYRMVQGTIQDCAARAKVPPIALDVLAWNWTHGK